MARPVKWSRDLHHLRERALTSRTETWSRKDMLGHVRKELTPWIGKAATPPEPFFTPLQPTPKTTARWHPSRAGVLLWVISRARSGA